MATAKRRRTWSSQWESLPARRGPRRPENDGRDARTAFREREHPRRYEQRTEFRDRSRSPERGDRYAGLQRYLSSHRRHGGHIGPGRARSSAEPSNRYRPPPRKRDAAPPPPPPPPPPPHRPEGGIMQRMSISCGRATFAGALRHNATAHDSRALTQDLGKARDLPELLSLEERYGIVLTVSILMPFGAGSRSCPLVASSAGCAIVLRPCAS